MKEENKTFEDEKVETTDWEPDFDSRRLDHLEGDSVNIHCINSSEFVVGRQTNFNGPVTIINCLNDSSSLKSPSLDHEQEKIIIKDKILSESATAAMGKYAEEKSDASKQCASSEKSDVGKKKFFFSIPIGIWIVFLGALIAAVIFLGFLFPKLIKTGSKEIKSCHSYNSTNNKFCIYSNFDEEGWRSIDEIHLSKPVQKVVLSHTDGNVCFELNYCITLVESFVAYDINNISYCHFYVGGDGNFYENPRKHLTENSSISESINICVIGSFHKTQYPTYPQIKATKNFLQFGVENNLLTKDYVVLPSRSIVHFDTRSSLYDIIEKWPHFKSDVIWIGEAANSTERHHINIYHKEDWKGSPATSFVEMKLPVPYVVISHSVTPQCFDLKSCSSRIRNMQSYHFSINAADIGYSFLVDSSGNIYEGRGWKNRNFHTGFVDGRNIGINFIGDYSKNIRPTEKQFEGVTRLIEYGRENNKIALNYTLVAHNATFNTLSPGKNIYAVIKNWPHFDPHPELHIKDFDDS